MTGRTRLSEWQIIDCFTRGGKKKDRSLLLGVGDDCAIMRGDREDWLISTDAFFEGIHFRREFTALTIFAQKALIASVSDIVAMGGEPRFFTLSLGLPRMSASSDAEALARGFRSMARKLKMLLIGGDTCRSGRDLALSLTAIGSVPKGQALRRSGARPGDAIYVTGPLGSSCLGLSCLQRGIRTAAARPFIAQHRLPAVGIETGAWLRKTGMVSSMIDVSDGLLADLGHIAEASRVGYVVLADEVPVERGYRAMVKKLGVPEMHPKLSGGEDYVLLLTVRAAQITAFEQRTSKQRFAALTRIGTIVAAARGQQVRDAAGKKITLKQLGWEHF